MKGFTVSSGDDVRLFNLAEAQQSELITRLFQAFDTLESTEEMKALVAKAVQRKLEDLKKAHVGVNKWELNYSVFENAVARRAENNRDLYRGFFLRYLSPHMRELVWQGTLQDGLVMREYEFNVKKERAYTVSRDDLFVLQTCQSVLRQEWHALGDESYEQLMVFKNVMVYLQAHLRKTVLPETHFYLMMPVLSAFRNFQTKAREKHLVSFMVTLLEQVHPKVAPKLSDRDERAYEVYIRNVIEGVCAAADQVDAETGKRLRSMLEIEDEEITAYYMDLMLNVRRGEVTHIPNADLSISKQQLVLGELLRSFVDRMSAGFLNVKATMIVWDAILIKQVRSPADLLTAFALVLQHLKGDFMRCRNVLQVAKLVREKAPLMHDYDFFVLHFNYYKDKDLSGAFDPPDVGVNRTCFPHMQDVVAAQLQKKLKKEEQKKPMNGLELMSQRSGVL